MFWYRFVLVLHLLVVIVGVGTPVLNGVYATKSKKLPGSTGPEVMRINFDVSMLADRIMLLIPLFGILLVLIPQHGAHPWSFGQTWVWLALALFIASVGLVHAVFVPVAKKQLALEAKVASGQGAAGDREAAAAAEKQVAGLAMVLNLATVAIIVLMVVKPGV